MARDGFGPTPAQLKELGEKARRKGDIQALGKLLSLVESNLRAAVSFLVSIKSKHQSLRVGITGPPGAGKSTLVNLIIQNYRKQGLRVGVLAVDPSSPFSGGALLGDRVRMTEHSGDKDVFIRSLGSRGGLGGLSAATGAMARILEFCGFDVVIIETVGVGQTELDIMNLADATAVVLVPESGDVVQTLKAGILEIADVFIVNKSDRSGADVLAGELQALVKQEGQSPKQVFVTSALKNEGVATLSKNLLDQARNGCKDSGRKTRRFQGELRGLILGEMNEAIRARIEGLRAGDVYSAFSKIKIPRKL